MSVFTSEGNPSQLAQAEAAVEGDIRDFVRRDASALRRKPEHDGEMVAGNISQLLQRVAASSVQEIDRLIADLQILRDRLQQEGERVQREIVEHATLSQRRCSRPRPSRKASATGSACRTRPASASERPRQRDGRRQDRASVHPSPAPSFETALRASSG
jgi:hypothetical protein